MFVTYRGSVFGLLGWQWRSLIIYGVLATAIVALDRLAGWHWFEVTTLPLGVLGGAIGIFVSFRTNSAYDRWWEGRRLWGQMVNTSRCFATQVLAGIDSKGTDDTQRAVKHALVRRQIAYVHVLRCALRGEDPFADEDVIRWLGEDELAASRGESNLNHALLHRQAETLIRLNDDGVLDNFRLQSLDRSIATLLDVQGGCERIKKTPFPPGYGYLASRLIYAYAILMPLGIINEVGWAAIPLTMLVCIGFTLISEVGRVLEDPFTLFWPALPLAALSKTIEINLRQRLGERELPPLPQANERGILM
jgi:ion channel-forming bestrophin family protein